ncbi:16S rRNA pseudouridine(516) synthase RsuA [Alkalimarinus sediminis]|uniref:Pseudouridine synthase n=1 Tax=Alkalimarinus sediminis TaxID=1632866 RepID=A0A9E8HG53_9ALTE|nr:16S rRNA pseudouridine(516) synthase RsuA [Alkalimarinus sediminis]UZW73607.1 16S rRNA pseudouridine(516) synthase RsuA [Alkalimarinus sediminis]
MRLDKFLCTCTGLTRIQAKRVIGKGQVTVDGVVEKDQKVKINESHEVVFDGRRLRFTGPRYIMLNKPDGAVCTSLDDDYRSVFGLFDLERAEELLIAGRLDADTTGLLLITDDGKWSHNITSPKKQCRKRYYVVVADPIPEDTVERFAEGIMLKGEKQPTLPAELEILAPNEALLTIHEGKYHQVKRMFGAIGNRVVELHREQVGDIALDEDLELGEWRYLTTEEVDSVK